MNNQSQKFQRLIIAATLSSGLLTTGIASAQTAAIPNPPTTTNATSISMSTVDTKAKHRAEVEAEDADARRVEFRHLGTSL